MCVLNCTFNPFILLKVLKLMIEVLKILKKGIV